MSAWSDLAKAMAEPKLVRAGLALRAAADGPLDVCASLQDDPPVEDNLRARPGPGDTWEWVLADG